MSSDSETALAIGRLQGTMDQVLKTMAEQGKSSEESRRRLYERVGELEVAIAVAGQTNKETSDRIGGLERKINKDVMPIVKEVKGWKNMGMGALGIIGIGGAAFAAFAIWAWDVIWSKLH